MNASTDTSNTENTQKSEVELSNLEVRYKQVRTVTLVGGLVNFILAIVKMVVGKLAFSHALFVDGIHSLSDLISDLLVLYAAKQGSKSPDEDHPYGHARIETFFTVIFGFILISVGLGILIDAIHQLSDGVSQNLPTNAALIVALISVISKEILFQYTLHYAKILSSPILKANAWHHRSDAVSSVVVLVGVAGSMYGIPYLDIVAAVIVAMMIAKIGWDLVYESVNELVDKGLAQEELDFIKELIENIPGIVKLHSLRTRQMGSQILVDVHIEVYSYISVSEGHRISDEVYQRLVKEIEKISEVLVHVDPEDDESGSSCLKLPLRETIIKDCSHRLRQIEEDNHELLDSQIYQQFHQLFKTTNTESIIIHYMKGKINLQILFPIELLQVEHKDCIQITKLQLLETTINAQLEQDNGYIHSVSLGFLSHKNSL